MLAQRKNDFEKEMKNWHACIFLLKGDETTKSAITAPKQPELPDTPMASPPVINPGLVILWTSLGVGFLSLHMKKIKST